tara:strand:- start:7657 stop:8019 length:363 start_codon:yes stop_codon:yes gene_type:complete
MGRRLRRLWEGWRFVVGKVMAMRRTGIKAIVCRREWNATMGLVCQSIDGFDLSARQARRAYRRAYMFSQTGDWHWRRELEEVEKKRQVEGACYAMGKWKEVEEEKRKRESTEQGGWMRVK